MDDEYLRSLSGLFILFYLLFLRSSVAFSSVLFGNNKEISDTYSIYISFFDFIRLSHLYLLSLQQKFKKVFFVYLRNNSYRIATHLETLI